MITKIFNFLGWGSTTTSIFVNVSAVVSGLTINEKFAIGISCLSAIFIVFKIYRERVQTRTAKLREKEEIINLQLKQMQYEEAIKKISKEDKEGQRPTL